MRYETLPLAVFQHFRRISSLDAAFDATLGDQYNHAYSVAAQVEQHLQSITPPPDYAAAVKQIIDTGEMPQDFATWRTEFNVAQQRFDDERNALQALRNQAAATCQGTLSEQTPQILSHLHRQLCALIDRARPAAEQLAGITEAEEVMRAGADAVNAFTTLDQCWTEYTDIRMGQSRILANFVDATTVNNCRSALCGDEAANDAYLSNLDDIFPDWRQRPGQKQRTVITDSGIHVNPVSPPWPERGPMQLKWFIANGAEFWVPTAKQIEELHTARMWRINEEAYLLTLTPEQRERFEKERAAKAKPKPGPERRLRDRAQRRGSVQVF